MTSNKGPQGQEPTQHPQEPSNDVVEGSGDVASVITVDKHEDVATICGRLDSAPTFAVVIHAPRGNQQLASEYGMRRLRRFADETGHAIAIATGRRSLASRARGAGLPVARRPSQVRWDRPGRNVVTVGNSSIALPALGQWPGVLAICIGFVLIALSALFVFPSATVTVIVSGESVTKEVEVTIVGSSSAADPAKGLFMARTVTLDQTVLVAVKTTGTADVPSGHAASVVIITAPERAIEIPAGAALLAGEARFRLDSAVSLGPAETASTTATAVLPGPAANVGAGAINTWEDQALQGVQVSNPNPAGGGTTRPAAVVTDGDMQLALQNAAALAQSNVVLARLPAVRNEELVIAETLAATVKARESQLKVGDPADLLVLEVDVAISGNAVPADDLVALAESLYEAGPEMILDGSVDVRQLEPSSRSDTGTYAARVAVTATLVSAIEHGAIKDAAKGRRPGDAKENLLSRYRMDDVEIKLWPGWAPFVPRFGARIRVETRAASGEKVEAPSGS